MLLFVGLRNKCSSFDPWFSYYRSASRPRGVLPYIGHIGMCDPKGYGFSAVSVINRVSNLADSGHK